MSLKEPRRRNYEPRARQETSGPMLIAAVTPLRWVVFRCTLGDRLFAMELGPFIVTLQL